MHLCRCTGINSSCPNSFFTASTAITNVIERAGWTLIRDFTNTGPGRILIVESLITALENTDIIRISAASLVETGIVMLARYGDPGELEVDQFIHRVGVTVVPVTEAHAEQARSAYRRFGKGRHPARLNFGDCFAYALAVSLQESLLFTGDDFSKTDVQVVKY